MLCPGLTAIADGIRDLSVICHRSRFVASRRRRSRSRRLLSAGCGRPVPPLALDIYIYIYFFFSAFIRMYLYIYIYSCIRTLADGILRSTRSRACDIRADAVGYLGSPTSCPSFPYARACACAYVRRVRRRVWFSSELVASTRRDSNYGMKLRFPSDSPTWDTIYRESTAGLNRSTRLHVAPRHM